jgi:hypothetical protein
MRRVLSKMYYRSAITPSISGDFNAVMELPHKLMISIIILTITIPILIESTEDIVQDRYEDELLVECEYFANAVRLIYQQSVNSMRMIELNLPDSTEYISAGGNFERDDPDKICTIRFKTVDGEEGRISVNVGNSYISMCNSENERFDYESGGLIQVQLSKCETNLDLNSDDLIPDFFIKLALI